MRYYMSVSSLHGSTRCYIFSVLRCYTEAIIRKERHAAKKPDVLFVVNLRPVDLLLLSSSVGGVCSSLEHLLYQDARAPARVL